MNSSQQHRQRFDFKTIAYFVFIVFGAGVAWAGAQWSVSKNTERIDIARSDIAKLDVKQEKDHEDILSIKKDIGYLKDGMQKQEVIMNDIQNTQLEMTIDLKQFLYEIRMERDHN